MSNDLIILAAQLRKNRQAEGVKPTEFDQNAYLLESLANLRKKDLRLAKLQHSRAVQAAVKRKSETTNSRK